MAEALQLLSAGSIRTGVSAVAALFGQSTGIRVEADFTSAPKVRQRVLGGERPDVVIASSAALDALAAAGCVDPATRIRVGSTPMAVAMRTGRPIPDLSTVEAFTAALRRVDLIACNEGSSGIHARYLIDRLGLHDRPGPEIRVCASGAEVFEQVATSAGTACALVNVTNILDQVAAGAPICLAAPLPAALQNVTVYEAAVASGCTDAGRAARFVELFASASARQRLVEAGVE